MTVFVTLFSGMNQFFGLRYPSLSIGYVVAQLLVFPIGRTWEKLPRWRVPLGKLTFDVNPGPFSVKEHALIVIVRISSHFTSSFFNLLSTVREYQRQHCLCHRITCCHYQPCVLESGLRRGFLVPLPPYNTNAGVSK